MKKNNMNKISTWTLWSPLKFATISFMLMISTAFIYSLIANAIYGTTTSPTPLIILLSLGFIGAVALQIRALPRQKMDRASFSTVHNLQTIILSVLFIISSYMIARYAQQIMFYLLILETRVSSTFILTLTASLLFYLYLLGLLFANMYAKFQRIREFKIPIWKIIFSIPFGFSALWTPGYILDYGTTTKPTYAPKSKWLSNATKWIVARPINTIATFVLITVLSGFFFGFNSILLTFALTLIFGIWTLQTGTKPFIKNMPGKYATTVVIFNIIMVIMTIGFFAFFPATTQDVQPTPMAHESIEIQQP